MSKNLDYLKTHNKNLTKKQYFAILDLEDEIAEKDKMLKEILDSWDIPTDYEVGELQHKIEQHFKYWEEQENDF
jgi:hypothetical protein